MAVAPQVPTTIVFGRLSNGASIGDIAGVRSVDSESLLCRVRFIGKLFPLEIDAQSAVKIEVPFLSQTKISYIFVGIEWTYFAIKIFHHLFGEDVNP